MIWSYPENKANWNLVQWIRTIRGRVLITSLGVTTLRDLREQWKLIKGIMN